MSSKYKNMNRITKPMSMFRYPSKKWKFDNEFTKDFDSLCPLRMLNQSIITQTFPFDQLSISKIQKNILRFLNNQIQIYLRTPMKGLGVRSLSILSPTIEKQR